MTFSLFESAPDRKDCFIQFWIYFIYGIWKRKINVLQNFYLVLHVLYYLFDCISFFQRLLKTLRRKAILPERYENSSVTSKSTKHHSDIKMHGKNRKRKKVLRRLVCQGTSCRQKLIYHASLRNFWKPFVSIILIWFDFNVTIFTEHLSYLASISEIWEEMKLTLFYMTT